MKPFDLEKALAGAKCITRYGCEAYVKYREDDFGTYPLRGFYYIADDGHPTEARWTIDGCYSSSNPHPLDIFMAPDKKEEPAVNEGPVATIYFDGSFSHVLWHIPAHLRCSMDVYAAPTRAFLGADYSYHPCILAEGLKWLDGGGNVLAEWDSDRAKSD